MVRKPLLLSEQAMQQFSKGGFDIRILQRLAKRMQGNGLHAVPQRIAFIPWVHHPFAGGLQVITGTVKTAFHLGVAAALDLDGPQLTVGPRQQQVNFSATAGAVIKPADVGRRTRQNAFDAIAFPAGAQDHVREQCFVGLDVQQRMDQAAVAHINLGSDKT